MKRVLVIDDDEQVRALLCEILERAGYSVREAADGAAGLKLFRADPADLVITDLIMPQKEGMQIILELRRDFPNLPLVAISGGGRGSRSDHLTQAKEMGVQRTVCKPFSKDEILQVVREVLAL